MAATVCPDRPTIERLLLGEVDHDDAEALDRHLLACERCCAVLDELARQDALAAAVRGLSALPATPDEAVQAVIAHLKEVTLPGKAMEETVARTPEHTEDAWDLEELLDPPEAEGELGRFGGYRVLRVLGAGGMGLVLEAEDPKLRRRVALKVMKRSLAARNEHHERFLREARAAAAIEHPHIVTVHQVGEHRGLPFMAMQLLKGEALDDRLRRENASKKEDGLPSPSSTKGDGLGRPSSVKGALPVAECLRIGRETAEALAEAHSRNLIHRDIKPGNIWLEGASGWVKLVDFGLAHAAEDVHLTQTGAILGTPAYMSPEQARGEAVDGRCDLYSLGAVLYKLTTGEVPFRGTTTLAVLMALANEAPRPPGEINPDIPPALNDLIVRLLAKKSDERFPSAEAVAEAIREIETEIVERNSFRSDAVASAGAQERNEFRSTNRRWPLVAAAAAAFVLATIVIVVRDRHGNEVMRATVPEDGSVTVTDTASASKVNPALRDGGAGPSREGRPTPPPGSVGATLPEPPPLDEWLKGRTELTVSQNGRGKFKTIQAALDALKPGRVVRVLDRGPYREKLSFSAPPDTGLVSDANTIVEFTEVPEGTEIHHVFVDDGFRLSGFVFRSLSVEGFRQWQSQVGFAFPSGLVIENCIFQLSPNDRSLFALNIAFRAGESPGRPCVVRESIFDGLFQASFYDGADATLVLERNWFRDQGVDGPMHISRPEPVAPGAPFRLLARHNVIDGRFPAGISADDTKGAALLEIYNNTLRGSGVTFNVLQTRTPSRAAVRNNIFGAAMHFPGASAESLAAVAGDRRLGPNLYPAGEDGPWKQACDLTGAPRYLSPDPASRDYLRLPADSPASTGGAGGDWPSYLGALPPGPAPKEGDWFTRLQERWQAMEPAPVAARVTDITPPADVPEPPPLEEWLKGRDVLTVAQDGSGKYKTIQAALDALQAGQVVNVLDRGPYRERLVLEGVPRDTGLISKAGTVVELTEWKFAWKEEGGDMHFGHVFADIDGFRLHGFEWGFPEKIKLGRRLYFRRTGGLLLEGCHFRSRSTDTWDAEPVVLENFDDQGPVLSIWVRHCLIEGYLALVARGHVDVTVVVEQNYFTSGQADHHVHFLGDAWRQVVVRHNVFRGESNFDIVIQGGWKPSSLLAATNNTSATTPRDFIVFTETAQHGGLTIRNNLRTAPRLLGVIKGAETDLAAAQRDWHVDHNAYPDPPATQPWMKDEAVPRSASDVAMKPTFLSKDPADPDYLRIRADGPLVTAGAGGDWPNYVGALPPGPRPKEGDWFTRLRERWQPGDLKAKTAKMADI